MASLLLFLSCSWINSYPIVICIMASYLLFVAFELHFNKHSHERFWTRTVFWWISSMPSISLFFCKSKRALFSLTFPIPWEIFHCYSINVWRCWPNVSMTFCIFSQLKSACIVCSCFTLFGWHGILWYQFSERCCESFRCLVSPVTCVKDWVGIIFLLYFHHQFVKSFVVAPWFKI